jgi:Ca2+-binding RTX toxin-like protein
MTPVSEPFAAVLEPDPGHLQSLRLGLTEWLGDAGIDGSARDDVVFAAHEAAASAMTSPGEVLVDASVEGDRVTVVVASDDGWQGPDDDVEGQRIRLLREVMSDVSFETLSGRSSLRLEKSLAD